MYLHEAQLDRSALSKLITQRDCTLGSSVTFKGGKHLHYMLQGWSLHTVYVRASILLGRYIICPQKVHKEFINSLPTLRKRGVGEEMP